MMAVDGCGEVGLGAVVGGGPDRACEVAAANRRRDDRRFMTAAVGSGALAVRTATAIRAWIAASRCARQHRCRWQMAT
jgi:hypothetical protein